MVFSRSKPSFLYVYKIFSSSKYCRMCVVYPLSAIPRLALSSLLSSLSLSLSLYLSIYLSTSIYLSLYLKVISQSHTQQSSHRLWRYDRGYGSEYESAVPLTQPFRLSETTLQRWRVKLSASEASVLLA